MSAPPAHRVLQRCCHPSARKNANNSAELTVPQPRRRDRLVERACVRAGKPDGVRKKERWGCKIAPTVRDTAVSCSIRQLQKRKYGYINCGIVLRHQASEARHTDRSVLVLSVGAVRRHSRQRRPHRLCTHPNLTDARQRTEKKEWKPYEKCGKTFVAQGTST